MVVANDFFSSAKITKKRDIRKSRWFEEIADYFSLEPNVIKDAVPIKRIFAENEPLSLKNARSAIRQQFMTQHSIALHEKILNEAPERLTDMERSESWKEYIFVCINSERRSFQRMYFYDMLIDSILQPKLNKKEKITVLDYGCGSSLFTRLIAQDYPEKVNTVSVDVGKYAVGLSVARNKLFNSCASGMLLDDVMSVPHFHEVDVILAHAVFEHLPNSTKQIKGLIDSLGAGGILIENYSGHSQETPHKSDTFSAYQSRDTNIQMLENELELLFGVMPERDKNGIYGKDKGNRFWLKDGLDMKTRMKIIKKLKKAHSFFQRGKRAFLREIKDE